MKGASDFNAVFGLYLVITDPVVGYARCAEAAVVAGVRYVQLRMKNVPRDQILKAAEEVRAVTAGTETFFIVNDSPAIAAEAGADGVHLGQDDMPINEVRRLYPELRVIGLSTHSLSQAVTAAAEKPAYIGVGPVFRTPTKAIPDPVLGVELAGQIIKTVAVPAVAIGGINAANLSTVLAAGATNFAVVRAVCQSPAPLDAIRCLMDIWRGVRSGAGFNEAGKQRQDVRVAVVGASAKPDRYSNKAIRMLLDEGYGVVPVHPSLKSVEGLDVVGSLAAVAEVDTVTLYVAPARQKGLGEEIVKCGARRVIFNPGTENAELMAWLREQGVEVVEGCTLVMLRSGQF